MLEIRKKGNKNFTHIATGYTKEYGANDITIIFDGNTSKLRSVSGRVIFDKDGYDLANISIYDDSTGGSVEVFTNITSLKQRLINLGYPFGGDTLVLTSDLIKDLNSNDSVSHTGDILETIVKTYTIPANTIPSECVISALIAIKKVGGLDSAVFEFGLSEQSNGLFHLLNIGNNPYVLCERKFTVKNGEISCFGVSGSTFNDVGVNSTRFSFAFDVAASNNFDLRFRLLDDGDEMILDYVEINIL